MNANDDLPGTLRHTQRTAFAAGIIVLAVCGAWAVKLPTQFYQSYLMAFIFWIGLSLGCLAILMTHHLCGGRWGFPIRRLVEAGSQTLPLMLVLFAPILFGMRQLYVWMRPEAVNLDPLLQHKHVYLNQPFFIVRTILYFASWLWLMWMLDRAATAQDRAPGPAATHRLAALGAGGLVLHTITMTFAMVDWAMSLEPHFFSTIYGILFFAGQALSGFAFVILALALLMNRPPLSGAVEPLNLHDLGNFLLTFVIFWAYIAFSQFLIIWSGNLAEEIPWYVKRFAGGWKWYALGLVALHFFVPFFLLLMRELKRRRDPLAWIAALVFVMCIADVIWQVVPAFYPDGFSLHWMDILVLVGIGALWMAVFLGRLRSRSLLPVHDARLEEQYRWS